MKNESFSLLVGVTVLGAALAGASASPIRATVKTGAVGIKAVIILGRAIAGYFTRPAITRTTGVNAHPTPTPRTGVDMPPLILVQGHPSWHMFDHPDLPPGWPPLELYYRLFRRVM